MNEQANDIQTHHKMGLVPKLILFLVLVIAFVVAFKLAFQRGQKAAATNPNDPVKPVAQSRTKIGIAYGTEKRTWLEWAKQQFEESSEGKSIEVDLIPLGSLEAAQKIWRKDERIHVWSPASALYKDVFVSEWQGQHGKSPILKEESLALSPMVFVMWEDRYQPFVKKYGEVSFKTIAAAMNEKAGWDAIAQKPDWMFFKFSHTHPNESNSGLMTLVLMAYDHFAKHENLSGRDLTNTEFQGVMEKVETGLVAPMGRLIASSGTLMDDMVRKGPSTYDAIFTYEDLAIDKLKHAEGRWDRLRIVYPKYNMWNDNPYYVLDVPWSSGEQRKAAQTFLAFLLSERVQQRALEHGFRPANTSVSTRGPESPFVKYADFGLKADLGGAMCTPVRAEVINGLLARWQQIRGGR